MDRFCAFEKPTQVIASIARSSKNNELQVASPVLCLTFERSKAVERFVQFFSVRQKRLAK
jgi:hypothetical protein